MSDLLDQAFDPDEYRRQGHAAVELFADYLERCQRRELPVLPWQAPEAHIQAWQELLQRPASLGNIETFFEQLIARSLHLHHPGYVGHQVSPAAPLAALAELAVATLNNSLAIYETGPAGAALETAVVRWLADRFSLGATAGGVLTSGGSLGNLTALLAARQHVLPGDPWHDGTLDGAKPAVLASEDCHYSVARAAKILGWGNDGVVTLPLDAARRIRPDALPTALERAQRAGRRVVALVGNAGSTAVGAYDPLPALADFCAAHGLWLHVDAAHGGGAIFADEYRALLAGIERADSLVVDCHKMLLCSSLCTAVLFREERTLGQTFAQRAAYLLVDDSDERRYDLAARALECTKPLLAARLALLIQSCGPQLFGDYIRRTYGRARELAELVTAADDLELATQPQANIVCFRLLVPGCSPEQLDQHNSRIRREVVEEGRFYLVQTPLDDRLYLRTTLMNPFTTRADLVDLLATLRRHGHQ